MDDTLQAGAARRTINPPLGIGKIGGRLFGDPIQWIESDLTATALVLSGAGTKVAIVAADLCTVESRHADTLRGDVSGAIGVPPSHVLFNESHDHSAPALPGYYPDWYESEFKEGYFATLRRRIVDAAVEADGRLQPARIGTGWGESTIGVYRRETRNGRQVLGEVPDHPIDPTVGVIRVDDLDGNPIAIAFRYSAHPVTVGGRSQVASADYPGPAREVLERNLGGLALFLQGCGGNINPRVGIGYEVDCSDTKNRVELPTLEEARSILEQWQARVEDGRAGRTQDWELRVAVKMEAWARRLLAAVEAGGATHELRLQAIRVNDIPLAGMNVETFFETGLEIRARSPLPDTFVLGYTNGSMAYLPRAEDQPEGGWTLGERYALPDQIPQFYPGQLIALHPESEQRALEGTVALIRQLTQ